MVTLLLKRFFLDHSVLIFMVSLKVEVDKNERAFFEEDATAYVVEVVELIAFFKTAVTAGGEGGFGVSLATNEVAFLHVLDFNLLHGSANPSVCVSAMLGPRRRIALIRGAATAPDTLVLCPLPAFGSTVPSGPSGLSAFVLPT